MERIRQVVRTDARLETVYPEPAMIEMAAAEKEDIRRMIRAVGKQPKVNKGTMLETRGTIAADRVLVVTNIPDNVFFAAPVIPAAH